MHAISFQYKRAHLMTTAYAQKAVARIDGMTPARYDVLALLREHSIRFRMPARNDQNWMLQCVIVRRLGLSPSTVSKMLRRMEEMRWIRRYRDRSKDGDARTKMVELTELGLRRAHRAMRHVYRGRLLTTPFERIVRQLHPTVHVTTALQKTWDSVDAVARFFGDCSNLHYEGGSARERGGGRPRHIYDAWRVGGEAYTFLDAKLARPELSRPMAHHYGDREIRPTCDGYAYRGPKCSGTATPTQDGCGTETGATRMTREARAGAGDSHTRMHARDVRCRHRWRRAAQSSI